MRTRRAPPLPHVKTVADRERTGPPTRGKHMEYQARARARKTHRRTCHAVTMTLWAATSEKKDLVGWRWEGGGQSVAASEVPPSTQAPTRVSFHFGLLPFSPGVLSVYGLSCSQIPSLPPVC